MVVLFNKNIHAPLEDFNFVHLHFTYTSMTKLKRFSWYFRKFIRNYSINVITFFYTKN